MVLKFIISQFSHLPHPARLLLVDKLEMHEEYWEGRTHPSSSGVQNHNPDYS